jgi:hypothetical protein
MSVTVFDSKRAAERWSEFSRELPVRPIRSDADYEQMVALMNQLLDVVGEDETHPLGDPERSSSDQPGCRQGAGTTLQGGRRCVPVTRTR